MRELKYRAWDTKAQQMIQSGIQFNNTNMTLDCIPSIELMQYTGLKDKNGKEIYEGDILAPMANDYQPEYKGNWEVVFEQGAFFGKADDGYVDTWLPYWYPDTELEVIGNSYENPELLEV